MTDSTLQAAAEAANTELVGNQANAQADDSFENLAKDLMTFVTLTLKLIADLANTDTDIDDMRSALAMSVEVGAAAAFDLAARAAALAGEVDEDDDAPAEEAASEGAKAFDVVG